MQRRPRQNLTPAFKAKAVLAAIKGGRRIVCSTAMPVSPNSTKSGTSP